MAFGELALWALAALLLLQYIAGSDMSRAGRDPIIDEVAHLFMTALTAAFTVIMLKHGMLRFAALGGAVLIALIVRYIKDRAEELGDNA